MDEVALASERKSLFTDSVSRQIRSYDAVNVLLMYEEATILSFDNFGVIMKNHIRRLFVVNLLYMLLLVHFPIAITSHFAKSWKSSSN